MKKVLVAGVAVFFLITTVKTVSGESKKSSPVGIMCAPQKTLTDTVPGKTERHKRSDTSGGPQRDTTRGGH